MINYSTTFNGWFGKTAHDFTYEHLYKVAVHLAKYYKENSTSGQKLIIGYDPRVFAKEFAEFVACIMAENGVKVFFGNKFAPSSVLVISALHKKSMGTVVLTGDSHDFRFMGLRAFNNKGYLLTNEDLIPYETNKTFKKDYEFSFKKWIGKGYVEPFDPSICYMNHLDQAIDFSSLTSASRLLFNPLHGSTGHYFDFVLHDKGLRGYTIDNEILPDFKKTEPSPHLYIPQLYDDMVFHGADLGFIISPNGDTFEFLIEPYQLKVKETLYFLLDSFMRKNKLGTVLLTDNHSINIPSFAAKHFVFKYVKESEFQSELRKKEYVIGIDSLNRFYFEHHGSPDALLCGYYLVEMLTHKELTPKKLHQKLNQIKGVH